MFDVNSPPIHLNYKISCPVCKTRFLRARPNFASEEDGTEDQIWSACDICGMILRMESPASPRRVATQDEIDQLAREDPMFHRRLLEFAGDMLTRAMLRQAVKKATA
jgi:hypothetical protein